MSSNVHKTKPVGGRGGGLSCSQVTSTWKRRPGKVSKGSTIVGTLEGGWCPEQPGRNGRLQGSTFEVIRGFSIFLQFLPGACIILRIRQRQAFNTKHKQAWWAGCRKCGQALPSGHSALGTRLTSYLSPPSLLSFPGALPTAERSLGCPSFPAGDSCKEKGVLGCGTWPAPGQSVCPALLPASGFGVQVPMEQHKVGTS